MNELDEGFKQLEEPLDPEIQTLFRIYSEWTRAGVPIYDSLDFLDRPGCSLKGSLEIGTSDFEVTGILFS